MANCVAAFDLLRSACLRRWKRQIRTSFWTWARREARVSRGEAHGGVAWKDKRQWQSTGPTPGYEWKSMGRAGYKDVERRLRIALGPRWHSGVDAVIRAQRAGWWEWHDGSGLFFWQWPSWYGRQASEGVSVWVVKPLPRCQTPQRREANARTRSLVAAKLDKVRTRRYISEGIVTSLTSYFLVPKGPEDIRMVYDRTASGLNNAI